MKKFTRLTAVLMAAILCVFALASCFEKTAFDLYDKAEENLEKAGGYEVTAKVGVTVGSTTTTVDMSIKKNGNNFCIETDSSVFGLSQTMTVTYMEGVAYVNMKMMGEEMKGKATVSLDKLTEAGFDPNEQVDIPELTKDMLKDTEVTVKDGISTFSAKIDGKMLQDELMKVINSQLDGMLEDEEETGSETGNNLVTVGDVDISVSIDKNNNFTAMTVNFPISVTVMGEKMEMNMKMEYTFVNPGQAPAVSAPADADQYEETDFDEMFGEN